MELNLSKGDLKGSLKIDNDYVALVGGVLVCGTLCYVAYKTNQTATRVSIIDTAGKVACATLTLSGSLLSLKK
ncbi:MAG: hypothetical protein ACRCZO_08365 [Cetobacterium sp.]